MLTIKDKIEQFKRDCRSNGYYIKAIAECNERIEEIDLQLTGMGSSNSNDPKCENTRNPYKENKLGLIVLQDKIIRERDDYIKKINSVSSKLMSITDIVDRQMITELYIQRSNHQNVADKYHYDRRTMYRHVDNAISKII